MIITNKEVVKNERKHGWAFRKAALEQRPMSDIGAMRTYNFERVPFVDISTVSEYGLTQKLPNSIRCF